MPEKFRLPYIIFECTPTCNLNCRYCYNIWKNPENPSRAPENSYRQAIRTLKKIFSLTNVEHVTFTGGEPFLAERFEELVLFVRLKRKHVTVITNGSGADEERYRTMIKLGVALFEIPVHAHDALIHDRITRVNGSWKKSTDSIRFLRENGAYVVPVIVITKLNAPFIEDTLKFIHSLGCQQIMMNRYNIGGEGFRQNDEILCSHDELREVFRKADQLGPSLGLKLSSNVCTPFCLLNPKEYPAIAFGSCSKNVERMPVTLDLEGNLRLCNHSPIVAGNIFKQSMEEIFGSPHVTGWLKETPSFCSECALYEKCLGGCRAASLQSGLGPDAVDPVMTFRNGSL
jgi:radical SAM protein with 4Fe4S-binding SPASM domain